MSETKPIEYLNLWMQQSQLFWSRLQTAAALHTGVLVAWHELTNSVGKVGVLCVGIIISCYLRLIMQRDEQYMEELRKKSIDCLADIPSKVHARKCAHSIVIVFCILETLLIMFEGLAFTRPNIRSIGVLQDDKQKEEHRSAETNITRNNTPFTTKDHSNNTPEHKNEGRKKD